ncbi:hypothetical protein ACEPAG_7536 [Sanghuangporus baumii]
MLFSSLVIVTAAVSAAFVGAQSGTASSAAPTSTAGISPCVLTCVGQASSSAGCSGITDIQCLCTSTTFQSAAAACLQSNCTAADLAAGQALQQQECASVRNIVSSASSLTGTAASSLSSASSAASSAASSVSSAATSALSSISSVVSSRTSSIGSVLSSATNAASSAASGAASSSGAGSKASFSSGAFLTVAIGTLGIAVGALLV